jgi:hypothetical protein
MRELKLDWEPMFLSPGSEGKALKTYRNDWLIAEYNLFSLSGQPLDVSFYRESLDFVFAFLERQFFNKNHFPDLADLNTIKLTLIPVIYFHNMFQGVSPALRLSFTL